MFSLLHGRMLHEDRNMVFVCVPGVAFYQFFQSLVAFLCSFCNSLAVCFIFVPSRTSLQTVGRKLKSPPSLLSLSSRTMCPRRKWNGKHTGNRRL